jgi:hypothetical protein
MAGVSRQQHHRVRRSGHVVDNKVRISGVREPTERLLHKRPVCQRRQNLSQQLSELGLILSRQEALAGTNGLRGQRDTRFGVRVDVATAHGAQLEQVCLGVGLKEKAEVARVDDGQSAQLRRLVVREPHVGDGPVLDVDGGTQGRDQAHRGGARGNNDEGGAVAPAVLIADAHAPTPLAPRGRGRVDDLGDRARDLAEHELDTRAEPGPVYGTERVARVIAAAAAHLLPLDLYNRPAAYGLAGRVRMLREKCRSTTVMRVVCLVPAFGVSIVFNSRLRASLKRDGQGG